jgi:hypothetical protein
MNREEMIKIMDEKGYELTKDDDGSITIDMDPYNLSEGIMGFRLKENYPIVFSDSTFEFKVNAQLGLSIENKMLSKKIFIHDSIPLLEQALAKLKELRGKNGL